MILRIWNQAAKRTFALLVALPSVGFLALWIDSLFNTRRFLFFPAGDVVAGFRSERGQLQWITHAFWEDSPAGRDYLQAELGYWFLMILSLLALVVFCAATSNQLNRPDGD